MDLSAQSTAKGKIQAQSERETGSCPRKQRQVRAKGQGKTFGGIKEPMGQKQDLMRARFRTNSVNNVRG